tara:strand:- start:5867 stop:7963 length:2097 start_codon:yes stop_codon:yes gene_type:complete
MANIFFKRVAINEPIALPANAGKSPNIERITHKVSESDGWSSNLPQAGNWSIINGSIYFKSVFSNVTIHYVQQADEAQVASIIGKNGIDALAKTRGSLEAQAKSFQFDKLNLEGSTSKGFSTVDGFKAVQDFAKGEESVTDEPLLAKVTATFGPGLTEAFTQGSALSAITGKTKGAGFLKRVTTNANPKAAFNAIKIVAPTLSESKQRDLVKGIAINPSSVVNTLSPKNDPKTKANAEVEKVMNEKLKNLNNCGFNLDPSSLIGGIGRSECNAFAHLVSKGLNVIQNPKDIGNVLANLQSSNITVPGVTFKNLIEKGKTNIRSSVSKGDATSSNVKNSTVFDITSANSRFAGYATPPDYVFTNVSSPEELFLEMSNATRTKSKESDSIRCLIVGWTAHLDGPPDKVNSKTIHELSKKFDVKFLTNSIKTTSPDTANAAVAAAATINLTKLKYGIQPHYVINRNGDLQRGRPIDETRNGDYSKFNLSGLKIVFVATEKTPPNQSQYETFDMFINEWFKVFPGNDVIGDYEIDNEYSGPGFNVKDRVNSKYKKSFIIDDPSSLNEMPSKVAQSITKPKIIAKASNSGIKKIDFNKINKDIQTELASEEFKNNLAKAQSKMSINTNGALSNIKKKFEDVTAAKALPVGGDKAILDKAVASVDNLLNISSGDVDAAIKATSDLGTQAERTARAISNAESINT